ncbi:MAG: hypothetical protein L0226_13725 [Acidobacteria bacterium]|nr:hypothetical protein [Acidobacteriota bacterium]
MITTAQTTLTATEAWREVEERDIAIVPAFGGATWSASVDIKGDARHNRKRAVRSVSAAALSPIRAVEALIKMLDASTQPQQLFDEDYPW